MDHLHAIAQELTEKGYNVTYTHNKNLKLHTIHITNPNTTNKQCNIHCTARNPQLIYTTQDPKHRLTDPINLTDPNSIEQLYTNIQTIIGTP